MTVVRVYGRDVDLGPLPTASSVAPRWWSDCGQIARLLRHLSDEGALTSVDDAWRIVEKPWNWTAEYEEMCRKQRGGK